MTKMGAALQEEVSKLHEENKRLKAANKSFQDAFEKTAKRVSDE